MQRKRSSTIVLLLTCLLILLLSGCTSKEEKKPLALKNEPTISLYINETGEKKNIKLEEYLVGVVAAEMDPNWPKNALAAQAILARTFTMENISTGRVKKLHGTDVSTDVEETQAYDPTRVNQKVIEAVKSTRGEVVLYQGNYVKAWYNACCGGVTANAVEGLNWQKTKTPYIKAGLKDGCLQVTKPENKNWTVKIPMSQVAAAIAKVNGINPGAITTVQVVEKGPSGRATKIKFNQTVVGAAALRLAVGNDVMRSTLISNIVVQGGYLVVQGDGYGHGVGMCQWGAYKMGQEGRSAEEIIKFYFKGVNIEKAYN